jgi:hypothetical protein
MSNHNEAVVLNNKVCYKFMDIKTSASTRRASKMGSVGQGQVTSIANRVQNLTLTEIEGEIQKHLDKVQKGQIAVCQLFYHIRQQKLYLDVGQPNFTAYCSEVWGWKNSQAYNMASAGEAIEFLLSAGEEILPRSVEQAAILCKVSLENRLQAWKQFCQEGLPLPLPTGRKNNPRIENSLSDEQQPQREENSGTPEFPILRIERLPFDGQQPPGEAPLYEKKSQLQVSSHDVDSAVSWLLAEFDIPQLAMALAKRLSDIEYQNFQETFFSTSTISEVDRFDAELVRANA